MNFSPPGPSRQVARTAQRQNRMEAGWRNVPEETPVAFSFYGTTHAVMMATPADLPDFATGFCLTETIIASAAEIKDLHIVDVDGGIDIQIKLQTDARAALKARQRHLAGPVGCGLCGIESIEQALRPVPSVSKPTSLWRADDIKQAINLLTENQPLNTQTRATHAAGFFVPERGMLAVREDVGRHNALDKLVGALASQGTKGHDGIVVVTSRVSVEMVQKTAQLGASCLVAISAPTALALDVAKSAGICVVALARGDEFEIFTHAEHIAKGRQTHVA